MSIIQLREDINAVTEELPVYKKVSEIEIRDKEIGIFEKSEKSEIDCKRADKKPFCDFFIAL